MLHLCDLQRSESCHEARAGIDPETFKLGARALHNISTWIPSLSESDKLGIKWKCYGTRARHVLVYGEASYGGEGRRPSTYVLSKNQSTCIVVNTVLLEITIMKKLVYFFYPRLSFFHVIFLDILFFVDLRPFELSILCYSLPHADVHQNLYPLKVRFR